MKNEEKFTKITTIKLSRETKERLEKLRVHRRETYDDIVQRMLNLMNVSRFNPESARRRLMLIERQKRRKRIEERRMTE